MVGSQPCTGSFSHTHMYQPITQVPVVAFTLEQNMSLVFLYIHFLPLYRANREDNLRFFLVFLKAVAEQYRKRKKAVHFVLSLLHLRSPTPSLFPKEIVKIASSQVSKAVPGDFANFLHHYIQKNSLSNCLLDRVEDIWV